MSGRQFDVLIEHGMVIDGSGNPGFRAAVGVQGDKITIIRGDSSGVPAHQRIDATKKIVAPGFIDIHSHSDLVLLTDPTLEMKIRQGVTTEIIGVDGLSYAPFDNPEDLAAFAEQNGGIAGLPPGALGWRTIGEQLESYDGRTTVNVGCLVGNTPLRIDAIGWGDEPADPAALSRMRARLREAMYDGAFGLSTGLDYPPGSHASTEEIVALARESARLGGIYHTHIRSDLGDKYLDPYREAIEIALKANSPLQVTHFARGARQLGSSQAMLELLESAREGGLDVTFDMYTYEWGGTRLSYLLPMWAHVGGPSALRGRLADPVTRARIEAEATEGHEAKEFGGSLPFADHRLGNLGVDQRFEGRFVSEVVTELDQPVGRVLCDLVQANPGASFTRPSPHAMTLWKFVCHPLGMIASDSIFIGSRPSPRAYGCFSRVLSEFVREERLLSLPEAIRKMTSFPAWRLGLSDRGLVQDNMIADLVVFDLDKVAAPASFEEPRRLAEGFDHVLVGGQPVLSFGRLTGATPGRALRGPAARRSA